MLRNYKGVTLFIAMLMMALVAAQCDTTATVEAIPTATPAAVPVVESAPAGGVATEPAAPAPAFEAAGVTNLPDLSGQTLHILTWDGYAPDELVVAFERATGAKVEITYIEDNDELVAKLQNEQKGWDIAQPTLTELGLTQQLYKLYQPIDTARVTNLDKVIGSLKEQVVKYSTVEGSQYGLPFTWGTSGLIVNTAKIKEPVTSYRQLCDAKYAGRITYRYRYATLVWAAYGLGRDLYAAADKPDEWRKIMEEALAYLVECDPNVKSYWTSRQESIDLMLREETYLAEGWDGTGWLLSQSKPEIKYVVPKEGGLGWVDTLAIPAQADNLEAAYAWINYMYEAKNAGKLAEVSGYMPAVEEAINYLSKNRAALIKESLPPEAIDNIKWSPPLTPALEEINAEMVENLRLVAENRTRQVDVEAITARFDVAGLAELPNLSGQTLRLLTWEGYAPDDLKQAFEQASGAKVEVTYVSDNDELISKLRENGGGWDLAQPTAAEVLVAQQLYHIYQPFEINRISKLAGVNSTLREKVATHATLDGQTYAVPFTWGATGLIVNTAKVKEPITSYLQLCDPKYAGRVTYRYRYAMFVATAYGLGDDLYAAANDPAEWQKIMEKSLDYLMKCRGNVRTYWNTRQQNIDLMLREETYLAEGWDGTGWLLSRQNPDIKFIAPKEGAIGFIDVFAVPAGAKNLNAAYAWINYLLEPKNAGKLVRSSGYLSAVDEAVNYLPKEQIALIKESYPQQDFDNIRWSPALTPEIKQLNIEIPKKLEAEVTKK
ncbi:MAG: extracellular solute-binding protein [Anaerolineae bacterium]|nr:extracellular solute-binding protein [Anaerolineae bacterium]